MDKSVVIVLMIAASIVTKTNQVEATNIDIDKIRRAVITDESTKEDADLTFIPLAEKYGYKANEFTINTEDGYTISLFRMQAKNQNVNKTPILLAHGIIQSGDSYLMTGPKYNMGFYLADKGYDLWFINFRGNRYSKDKTQENVSEYWNFSFHEMGIYDLPATMDFILQETGEAKLNYIAFSQGTTAALILLSKRAEYNEKIETAIFLSPVAFLSEAASPILRILSTMTTAGQALFHATGHKELFAHGSTQQILTEAFCKLTPLVAPACSSIMSALFGFDPVQYPYEREAVITGHEPAGTSSKVLIHFGQLFQKDTFTEYDYGDDNVVIYNQERPPEYNLSAVTVKTVLVWGESDWLSPRANIDKLTSILPNLLEVYVVPYAKWNHQDYMLAKDLRKLVGEKIVTYLN